MKYKLSILLILFGFIGYAQREHHVDLVFSSGSSIKGLTANVVKNFKLLPSEKLLLGVGIRGGYIFGSSTNYITAPAKHTGSSDAIDTLVVAKPQFFNVNISLNAAYHFTPKIAIGANIDFIGLAFGFKRDADFYPSLASQNESTPRQKLTGETVKPQRNSIFLTGDRNKGTLVSEVFIRITPIERFSIKAGYSYIITEYATSRRIGHKDNYRFRNTTSGFMIGLGYNFI